MLQSEHPKKVVVAVPVAPPDAIRNLKESPFVDEVICPLVPDYFTAVGQFYESFEQVDDKKVIEFLKKSDQNVKMH